MKFPFTTETEAPASLPGSNLPPIGNWSEQKNKLKERFKNLNYSDLQFDASRNEEMLNRIQIKLGITREELQKILETL